MERKSAGRSNRNLKDIAVTVIEIAVTGKNDVGAPYPAIFFPLLQIMGLAMTTITTLQSVQILDYVYYPSGIYRLACGKFGRYVRSRELFILIPTAEEIAVVSLFDNVSVNIGRPTGKIRDSYVLLRAVSAYGIIQR